jgi:uncharacterized protein (UPF0548 family)
MIRTPWRFGRGWSQPALRTALADLRHRPVSFTLPPEQMTAERGWTVDGDDQPIGREPPGPPLPDGVFARARQALIAYDFSDPRILVAHFDPRAPLLDRDMLLEVRVLVFRFLVGTRVRAVRVESDDHRSTFGFRYDTLEGHVETGYEWFVLSKNHHTGEVRLRIEAHWRPGRFPTWWSRLGFLLLGAPFRDLWRRRAIARLRRLSHLAKG